MIKCAYSMDKHGIPLLSKMQLENYAERLLQDFMPKIFDEAQPVDMDTFITNYMEFGFEYQYYPRRAKFFHLPPG